MLQNIILGILFISAGIWIIIFTYKNPDSQLSSSDIKGFVGGIGAIVIGIMCLLGKINW